MPRLPSKTPWLLHPPGKYTSANNKCVSCVTRGGSWPSPLIDNGSGDCSQLLREPLRATSLSTEDRVQIAFAPGLAEGGGRPRGPPGPAWSMRPARLLQLQDDTRQAALPCAAPRKSPTARCRPPPWGAPGTPRPPLTPPD